jgi:hypothetical protein
MHIGVGDAPAHLVGTDLQVCPTDDRLRRPSLRFVAVSRHVSCCLSNYSSLTDAGQATPLPNNSQYV